MYTNVYVFMCTCMYICICMCIYIYICTYVCMHVLLEALLDDFFAPYVWTVSGLSASVLISCKRVCRGSGVFGAILGDLGT